MIKYILFDCDGVLVDSEYLACKVLAGMLAPYGCPLTEETLMKNYVGMKDVEIVNILANKYALALPANFMQLFEKQLDVELEKNLQIIQGMDVLVKGLKSPKAIVSNSNLPRLKTSLKTTGLQASFDPDKLFTPDRTKYYKPDPRMYQFAVETLQLQTNEIVVVEDSPTGVAAAHGAGLKVIGFLGASHASENLVDTLRKNGADYIAQNSTELAQLLNEICS